MIFKKIPMLSNLYEISADGKTIRRCSTGKELKISDGSNYGYSLFVLTLNSRYPGEDILRSHPKAHKNGVRKDGSDALQITLKVHQLVYDAFVGSVPFGMVIDHIDRNKSNNAVSNLRAVYPAENRSNQDRKTAMYGLCRVTFGDGVFDFESKDKAIRFIAECTGKSYRTCFNAVYANNEYRGYVVTRV